MADDKIKKNLLLMFERPREPIFAKKGDNVIFSVPENFLTERYKPIGTQLSNRFGDVREEIRVSNISLPDMRPVMALGRNEQFSLWIPRHRKIAGRLIDIFIGMRTVNDLQSAAAYARDRVNPYLFQYALAVALLHRPDTKNVPLPSLAESFPDKFVDSAIFNKLREETFVNNEENAQMRVPIEIPRDYTASDLDPEHRLWYFREDLGVNLHHWHWHLVYPFEATMVSLVNKSRRGELFYYMHQQMVARYNFERLGNQLARVKRFNNFREPIPEGYFPKMDNSVASRAWPARADNSVLQDLNRELDQIRQDVSDLERWRDRILEAIHQQAAVNESGQRIPLVADGSTDSGIDVLGNMIESSILSPNRQTYGDMHNFGHVFLSYAHDPNHKHLESFGVMGDTATAMRDPVFYRWHAFVDDMFQEYKEQLPAYTTEQLTFPGIEVSAIQVTSQGGKPNTFQTFWNQSDVDFSRGVDFAPRGNVFVRFTHLNHTPYTLILQVENRTGATRLGMCRVFMAPKNDERGVQMLFRDQRLLMIELDKFVVQLNPNTNVIRQNSTASTVTVPFEQTFRNLDQNRPAAGTDEEAEFNFCGCGWPQHMLIPRGTPGGMQCDLFVMISDFELDKVDQNLVGACNQAAAYCGIRDREYPDRRPMGYPFDRVSRTGADQLANFVTPNMRVQTVTIVHSDTVRRRT
ncbi:phenoloxidase 2-like [Culicoides brevitarsis]|uniref:phenoloxidase 2-like n=1 Tax=Culicoides brevitarsis TaxID=469753 RepID=UPI00307C2E28